MNVKDLIEELQRRPPHCTAMVVPPNDVSTIAYCYEGDAWYDIDGVEVETNVGDIGNVVRIQC